MEGPSADAKGNGAVSDRLLPRPFCLSQSRDLVPTASIRPFSLIPSRGASAIATMCALWRSRPV